MQRVTPKKYFGQYFLKDLRIAERIAETIPDNIKNILEIGSGTGALTQFLLKKNDTNDDGGDLLHACCPFGECQSKPGHFGSAPMRCQWMKP